MTDRRLRIVFMGTPGAAVPTLEAVHAAGFPIPLVISQPDRRAGRGGKMAAPPVKKAALAAGLDVFQPENVNDPESVMRLTSADPDVVLIVAYGKILKKAVLCASRRLPLNVHFSLLPEFRGASPVLGAIAAGKTETGVSIQRVVKKLDAGPVLASQAVAIEPDETREELEGRLAIVGATLCVGLLERLEAGPVEEVEQDHEKATFSRLIKKEQGRIDWERPAKEIGWHIRAMTPWPGATTTLVTAARPGGTPVTILRGIVDADTGGEPGSIVQSDAEGIVVATGEGTLAITDLKPAGKRAQTVKEFLNGHRVVAGDHFES